MKKIKLILILFIYLNSYSQQIDSAFVMDLIEISNQENHRNVEQQLKNIDSKLDIVNIQLQNLKNNIQLNSNQINEHDSNLKYIQQFSDNLNSQVLILNELLDTASRDIEIGQKKNQANEIMIEGVSSKVSNNAFKGLLVLVFIIILVLLVYIFLTRKWNKETKEINQKQNEIFEKQIEDGQKIANWLSKEIDSKDSKPDSTEQDHSFAKRVADEIVRITTNLSRMDESIRGYKQLKASVRKLEQSLNANDYEIEDLLNKAWDPGMNLQANFVIDENLKPDDNIITKVIKPQINYKGKLIQAAQVEVSQGE